MSSFIVSNETIFNVVNAFFFLESKQRSPGFIHGTPTTPTKLAKRLLSMNVEACEVRYSADKLVLMLNNNDLSTSVVKKTLTDRPVRPDMLQAYKSIGCLLYQCSEGNIPGSSLYEWLVELKAYIADFLVKTSVVENDQTYEEKGWG